MLFYVPLILALTLAAVSGVLYFYAMFLEGAGRQQKRRIAELEGANAALREQLRRAQQGAGGGGGDAEQELWPEVIDEGGGLSLN